MTRPLAPPDGRSWSLVVAVAALGAGCGDVGSSLDLPAPAGPAEVDAAAAAPSGVWARSYGSACPAKTIGSFTVFAWTATTPGDSRIDLFVRAGDTEASAAAATRVHLVTARHQSGNGAFIDVGSRLGEDRVRPWIRVEGDLYPAPDGQAPTLLGASLSFDCLPLP